MSAECAMFLKKSLIQGANLKKPAEVEIQLIDGGIIIVLLRGVKIPLVEDVHCMREGEIYCMYACNICMLCVCACVCVCATTAEGTVNMIYILFLQFCETVPFRR